MNREVVRISFESGAFKTFVILPSSTLANLTQQAATKMTDGKTYQLWWKQPSTGESAPFGDHESVYDNYIAYKGDIELFFKCVGEAAATAPATVPVVSSSSGAITADDFDALLNQLSFDSGPASHGASDVGNVGTASFSSAGADLSYTSCSNCGGRISNPADQIYSFGMYWHRECLACCACRKSFAEVEGAAMEGRDGQAYCVTDYHEKYSEKCAKCSKPIIGPLTNALGRKWHPTCFTCQVCSKPFAGTFFELDGYPMCEYHYYDKLNLICKECDKPIIGKCVKAKEDRFHPLHFVCSFCKKQLGKTQYFYHDGKLFCREHSRQFYG